MGPGRSGGTLGFCRLLPNPSCSRTRRREPVVETVPEPMRRLVLSLLGDEIGPVRRIVQTREALVGGLSRVTPIRIDLVGQRLHLVLKEALLNPAALGLASDLQAHEREHLMSRTLRKTPLTVAMPVYGSAVDPRTGTGCFLLQDAGPQTIPTQSDGADRCLAEDVVRCLAHFHRQSANFVIDDPRFSGGWRSSAVLGFAAAFASSVSTFLERYEHELTPYSIGVTERLAARLPRVAERWSAEHRTQVIHGDARLANVVRWNERVRLIDWQMASCGEPVFDLAHFMIGSMTVEARRTHQASLIGAYAETRGDHTAAAIEDDVRRLALLTIPMNVVFGIAPASADVAESRRKVIRRYWSAVEDYASGDFLW